MKKLLLHLVLVPIEIIRSISIGFRLRELTKDSRVYIFDFDNTLAATAELINQISSYNYKISDLRLYDSMQQFLLTRQNRGHTCIVLSARPLSDKNALIERLAKNNLHVAVEVVRLHWLKSLCLISGFSFSKTQVIVIDDMTRGEETGSPSRLYFPRFIVPRNVRFITHQHVLRIR